MKTLINLFYLYAEHKDMKIEKIEQTESGLLIQLDNKITFAKYHDFCCGINKPIETTYKNGEIKILVKY